MPSTHLSPIPGLLRASLVLGALAALLLGGCTSREEVIARMQKNFAAANYRAALVDLRNLVPKEPGNLDLRLKFAESLLRTGDFAGAETQYDKALALGATPAAVFAGLTEAQIGAGEYQVALDRLDKAGPSPPVNLLELRGRALLGLHRDQDARAAWEAAIAAAPQDAVAHLGLAQTLARLGDGDGAKRELDAANAAAPGNFDVHLSLGRWYWLKRRAPEARAEYARALQLAQQHGTRGETIAALASLGEADCALADLTACNDHLQQLRHLAPKSEGTLLLQARLQMQRKDLAGVESTLRDLLSKYPNSERGNTLAGIVAADSGHPQAAQQYLSAALAQEPGNLQVRKLLAEVQLREHQPEQALRTATDPAAGVDAGLLSLAGRASLLQGDVAGGLGYFERSEQAAPADKRRALEVAEVYLATNRSADALTLLRKLDVPDALADRREWLLLAALERAGHGADVRGEAQQFAASRPRDLPAQLVAAQALESARDDADARALIARASALDAQAPQPWVQLGWIEWSQHNYPAADADFAHALQLAPKNDGALLGKAQSDLQAGHPDAAIAELEQVRAAAPRSLPPRVGLARLYLASGRVPQAAAALAEAQALSPKNPDVRLLGALIALSQGRGADAVATLQELAQQFPKAAPVQADLARAYLLSGRTADARTAVDAALKLDPNGWQALITQIALALAERDAHGADAALERLRHTSAPKATVLALTGTVAAAAGRTSDALQAFSDAYELAPSGQLAIQMAAVRRALHQSDPEGPLREWLKRAPTDVAARLTLAQMLQVDGQPDGAASEYETVLRQDAQQVIALNNLAWLKLQRGDAQGALDLAHRAYTATNGQPSVSDTYGWALVQTGHADDAVPVLRDAYGKMPGNIEVRFHLGAALVKSGALKEGRQELEAVAGSGDRGAFVGQARALLADLGDKGKS